MRVAKKARRLLANLLQRGRLESTLDAELRVYIAELTDRHLAQGLPPTKRTAAP